ncbi:MAG TPA: LCP family protein [Chloroflexota bacterium]|nr:LCP family protein [Chloroflexota bacterium]
MNPTRGFAIRLFALGGLFLLAAGIAVGYTGYVRPVAAAVSESTGRVVPRPSVASTDSSAPPEPSAGHGVAGRTNILLLGSDTDAKFVGVYDTQIMMVVTIDEQRQKVSMLSIPRDLWVPIPGWGMGKIGTAYHDGGLSLARETIERNFQIRIDYYAWVGLQGFINVIDTLGGVDVDVLHPITDDSYPDDLADPNDPYAYRRLYIAAGPQHLDGTTALEYVRSRHGDLVGDFGRSDRQQQVLQAVRSISDGKTVISRLPQIAADLQDSVRTDMNLLEIARFANLADRMKGQAVQTYVLAPPDYSTTAESDDGQDIVLPNWPAIRGLVSTLMS